MRRIALETEITIELLKESIGKHYRVYISSSDEGTDSCINSGIIEKVHYDYEYELLIVKLEGNDVYERLSIHPLKEINTVVKENYTLINPVYNDGSYFKIYITEKEND